MESLFGSGNRMMSRKTAILIMVFLVVVTALATFILTSMGLGYKTVLDGNGIQLVQTPYTGTGPNGEVNLSKEDLQNLLQYNRLSEIIKLIDEEYYGDTQGIDFLTAAAKGLVDALDDPYSTYYSPEEYERTMQQVDASLEGIGVSVSVDQEDGLTTIMQVYKETPAEEAGLLKGDKITKVDGTDVAGMELEVVASMLRGQSGTQVRVTIQRGADTFAVEITRRKITVERIESRMIENIGYMRIIDFSGNVANEFRTVLAEFEAQGAIGMVVDLRDNPGGSVDAVVDICDQLLPECLVMYEENKLGKRRNYNSKAGMSDIPLVLLVNENSASASEIMAGAMKDHQRAQMVGTKTYGKGIVQTIYPFTSDLAGIKLTTSAYFSPGGTNIHGVGISPDYLVTLPDSVLNHEEALTDENDTQLQKALELLTGE